MKIYVVTTGTNEITVSLNGEAAVIKTVKPTLTALGNGRIRFQCDDIDEEVETYRNIFINATPLKGSWIAEEDYLSVALFEAIINKTFTGGGGSSYLVASVTLTDAQIKALPSGNIEIVAAPGIGQYIYPIGVAFALNIVEAYTNVTINNPPQVWFKTSEIGIASSALDNFAFTTPDKYATLLRTEFTNGYYTDADVENKAVELNIGNTGAGNFTGGNAANTLKVTVYYVMIKL